MRRTTMDAITIEPLYKVTDIEKFQAILAEMQENGWRNIPAIAVLETDTGYFAITGSHRFHAARKLHLDIEVELYTEDEISDLEKRSDVDDEGLKALQGEQGQFTDYWDVDGDEPRFISANYNV